LQVVAEVAAGSTVVLDDVRRMVNVPDYTPTNATEFASMSRRLFMLMFAHVHANICS
jgi:hypothetical protein